MKVKLLHSTPLWVASTAIRKCWASEDKSDSYLEETWDDINKFPIHTEMICGQKDKELIERVGNKNKHSSTLEHLNYSFDIDGISRACLQELARHRMASLSVKSTRYTLKELKDGRPEEFMVETNDANINHRNLKKMFEIKELLNKGQIGNDTAKYLIPECYKTSLVWTVNARALQNFLSLRTDKSALWEIQDLAREIFKQLPEEHKYLFVDYVKEKIR